MKPLTLTIKGLNSFEQQADIDFQNLTKRGLFGIFGPTGSGKSSIIDGMTLALFGEVARGTKNFINVNTDKCEVLFEFQLGKEESDTYKISRSYRKDKETENARTAKARLEKIDGDGNHTILADQTRSVDEQCGKLLGMSKDDFSRTVILPQGKFSEFLKMTGKDRTQMLERIFRLEKYGTNLDRRVKNHRQEIEQGLQFLEGQKKGYQGVSKEIVREKKNLYKAKAGEKKEVSIKLCKVQEFIKEWEPVRDGQKELEEYRGKELQLHQQEPMIAQYRIDLEKTEKANELYQLYSETEDARKQYEESQEKGKVQEKVKDQAVQRVEEEKARKEEWDAKKEQEKPELEKKKSQMETAIGWVDDLKKLEFNLQTNKKSQENNQADQQKLEDDRKTYAETITAFLQEAEVQKKEKNKFFHSQTEKDWIQKGYDYEKEIQRLEKGLEKNLQKNEEAKNTKRKLESKLIELRKNWDLQKKEFEQIEDSLKKIIGELEQIPDVSEQKLVLAKAQIEQDNHLGLQKELEQVLKNEKKCQKKIQELAKEEKELTQKINEVQRNREEQERHSLALILAAELEEGEPCPVCGNTHHMISVDQGESVSEELQDLKKLQEELERKQQDKRNQAAKEKANLEIANERIEVINQKLNTMNTNLLELNIKDLKIELDVFLTTKSEKEKEQKRLSDLKDQKKDEIGDIRSQIAGKEAEQHNLEIQIQELEKEYFEHDSEIKSQKKGRQEIYEQMPMESYQVSWKKIREDSKRYERADKKLQQIEKSQKEAEKKAEQIKEQLSSLKEKSVHMEAAAAALMKDIEKIQKDLQVTVGTCIGIQERYNEVLLQIENLDKHCKEAKIKLDKAESRSREENEKYQSFLKRENQFMGNYLGKHAVLEKKMSENAVDDIKWIEENHKESAYVEERKEQIEGYDKEVLLIQDNIRRVEKKLNNRRISDEEWKNNTAGLEELKEKNETLIKEYSALENEVQRLEEKWKELEEIEKKLKAELHRQALVVELEKLFRGKAFVKYASMYYLDFVTRDANKRLRDITNGNYELAMSESGDFMMIDYKNGGKVRPCSTLSGGETFLVSLALALSLSKQIQLKGTTSIDLFFLDEGFGTLDDRFIDIVMDSLYQLRERGLNVGLITHVEAIKERIGARIMVSPAEAGMGGSKIEYEFI